jgi:hypothetical protein
MSFQWCGECHALIHDDGSGHFPYCARVTGLVKTTLEQIQEITKVTVPTAPEFDWSSITAHAVDKLREPKTPPPPPDLFVTLAQRSYEGIVNPEDPEGERLHVLHYDFGTKERAAKAAAHLRAAGAHTTPATSVTVVTDPEHTGSESTLRWKAGVRKGRK